MDEIIVVDTGSKDETINIARPYADEIYEIEWHDDFSKARNYACSRCSSEWILSIDADEQLEKGGIEKLWTHLHDTGEDAFRVRLEYGEETTLGIKVVRNRTGVFWVGKAHNNLNIPVTKTIDVTMYCDISPSHSLDRDRTLRILKKDLHDTPSNKRNLYYLAREYANRHDFQDAIDLFNRYVEEGDDRFLRADACLYLAKMYRATDDMRLARAWADKATHVLPEFKEAWDFCAYVAQDKFKRLAYLKFYDNANNKHVRIIRKFRWTDLNTK